MWIQRGCTLVAVSALFAVTNGFGQQDRAPTVRPEKLGTTRNVHACGKVFLAGQPSPRDIEVIQEKGITRVITLRVDGEIEWDEKTEIVNSGLDFIQIPFREPASLTDEVFDKVRKLLNESEKQSTLLHCGSANRVGAVWLTHRVLDQGVALETAVKEAKEIGLRQPLYEKKAIDYVKRKRRDQEKRP